MKTTLIIQTIAVTIINGGFIMSFINKISEKLSSGATAVSNSTKRMSEIAKLNSKINKNLSDVNSKYTEIGRIVKLELVDKIEHQEVKRLVSEIDALLTEVNESREKISDLKGVKVCSSCGAQVSRDAAFCPNCGAKQPVSEVQNSEPVIIEDTAPVIDITITENAVTPVTDTEDGPNTEENAEKAESAVEKIEKPEDKVFCPKCGSEEESGVKFCSQCGSNMNQ